ncbi:ISNCY family transposase [Plebeiibacterium sediminum]|uniref:ISNCY family transposase n=1 Tax=Plebeiibacterium sediminum TaxID=2992112 RepID=A0AAE3SHC6_9BACT|nr:ISNCY family transposase [Plebeiobacterium sediminum]MCW3789388.1 ISNCY family transposase [Plebeiobacterium sediminum]
MRKRFEQQITLGRLLIQDTKIPTAKRSGALPGLCAALKEIFVTPKWNTQVFEILGKKIFSENNNMGRPGMNLWQIFVLSQVRLCQNISYDDLHHIANYDSLIRQLMGIENGFGHERTEISYQNIIDNVGLLTDETVKELNEIIVEFGHEVFKKKEEEALCLKTDSFVVESNVHFPTDYNLLWDSARKCIDMVTKLQERNNLPGWRKIKNWRSDLKNKMRALGRASASCGKGKQKRLMDSCQKYLSKAKTLLAKLEKEKPGFPQTELEDWVIVMELERFMELLEKHIELLERRVVKGESIPHKEKMFSIFEQYTEWVTKGKMRPNVELGKKVAITTDQFNLIVDYLVMEHQSDSEIVQELAQRIFAQYAVSSWSFDKGFWNKCNKETLQKGVETLVLPKKGKCNKAELEEEYSPKFLKLRNRHSTVESNINELEHRGLDRCPDKGYHNFKRYVSLSISAYNLRKIGEQLIAEMRTPEKSNSLRKKAA